MGQHRLILQLLGRRLGRFGLAMVCFRFQVGRLGRLQGSIQRGLETCQAVGLDRQQRQEHQGGQQHRRGSRRNRRVPTNPAAAAHPPADGPGLHRARAKYHPKSSANARALAYRSAGFFSRAFRQTRSRSAFTCGLRVRGRDGSVPPILSSVSSSVRPEKGGWPVRATYKMAPKPYTSAATVNGCPVATNCSAHQERGRADKLIRERKIRRLGQLPRQPEIDDERHTRFVHQHVRRFQIAVQNAMLVGVVDRLGHGLHQPGRRAEHRVRYRPQQAFKSRPSTSRMVK